MADLSKFKRRKSSLGTPPPEEEASPNLTAPETAPVEQSAVRMDGRSMRRTHRTVQFATRVTPQFDMKIREIAARDGLLLVEVLERALDAYESKHDR
jgi:hypothetical protein